MAENLKVVVPHNNLYANGYIIQKNTNELLLKRDKLFYDPVTTQDKYHIFGQGDTLLLLAYRYYRDSKLWHIIADVNNIYNPLEIALGTKLLIPGQDQVKLIIF